MKIHLYYVYLMSTRNNGVLYVGVTNTLKRRVEEHKIHQVSGFTARYNVDKLVYYEIFTDVEDAIRREKCIKKWNRLWKNNLIEKCNPGWQDLTPTL